MSALPPIEPYVETYFWLSSDWSEGLPSGYVRRDTIVRWLTEQLMASVVDYGTEISRPYPDLASNIFDRFVEMGIVGEESNPVTGSYYKIEKDDLNTFRSKFLTGNELYRLSKSVGSQFFHDVFLAYSTNGLPTESLSSVEDVEVPASDRIVYLDHNQVNEVEEPLSSLITAVEQTNGDPDAPGFRERIIGQLKAGRELIRGGTFRAYFLYSLVLTALGELIAKHKGSAIALAAESLLQLLIQKIFSGS